MAKYFVIKLEAFLSVISFEISSPLSQIGNADLKFIAKDAAEQSVLTSSLSIRPSMPYQVRIKSGSTNKDKAELDVNYKQYSEFEERSVATSNVPTSFIDGLSFFLEKYPYG